MATVKMKRGDLVTHVYGDPDTIAAARKKGFRLVGDNGQDSETAIAATVRDTETSTGEAPSAEAETAKPGGKTQSKPAMAGAAKTPKSAKADSGGKTAPESPSQTDPAGGGNK